MVGDCGLLVVDLNDGGYGWWDELLLSMVCRWFLWCAGLTFWSPNINIFQDPKWRRG